MDISWGIEAGRAFAFIKRIAYALNATLDDL